MNQAYIIENYSKLKNPIIEAKFCDDSILVIDAKNILHTFNSAFSLLGSTRLTKDETSQHLYSNIFSVSNNRIAIPVGENLLWAQYNQKVKAVHKTDIHTKSIAFTSYSSCASYLLSCDEKGKAYLHDTASKTTCYAFTNKPDYCSYATISQKNRFAYIGYFNSTNTLLDLKNDTTIEFETKHPVELASFFDNEKKLFLADREGNSTIYDCLTQKIISRKAIFTQWPTAVVLSPNKKYFIVSTRSKKLYIHDPFKNEILQTLELQDSGVTSMDLKENRLLLSFTNGTLSTIDLGAQKEQFLINLQLKEYHKAKEILDINCFLYLDESIEKFKAGFDEAILKAKEFMTKSMLDKAIAVVKPFMADNEYRKKVDQLFMQNDRIGSFIEAVENNDIVDAYLIAKKYPIVESLTLYSSLENQWEREFAKARKLLEKDSLRGKEKAKEILALYERIPQKSNIVRRLLANVGVFGELDVALKKQDFALFFKLADEYSFLKDTLIYKRVENLGTSMRDKAVDFYNEGDYEKAKAIFGALLLFPSHKTLALNELNKVEQITKFNSYVEKNQKASAYSLAAQHPYLTFTKAFETLNKPFEEAIKRALVFANTADVKSARQELFDYLGIEELYNKMDSCMKVAYLKQIENSDFSSIKRTSVLKKYNYLFGLDNLLENLFVKKGYAQEYQNFAKEPKKIELQRYEDTI